MTLPANIRVNTRVSFPSLVVGSGPITIAKQNGIFTVGFSIAAFGIIIPPPSDFPIDYLLGYNSNTQTFFRVSMTNIAAAVNTFGRSQRSVVNSAVVIGPTDQILNLNLNAPQTIVLPVAATRKGAPLTFKDVGSQAAANNISVTPAGVETIDGVAGTIVLLSHNRQCVTITPYNDGVNTGWEIT